MINDFELTTLGDLGFPVELDFKDEPGLPVLEQHELHFECARVSLVALVHNGFEPRLASQFTLIKNQIAITFVKMKIL